MATARLFQAIQRKPTREQSFGRSGKLERPVRRARFGGGENFSRKNLTNPETPIETAFALIWSEIQSDPPAP
jgi:hypothetical protein